MAQVLNLRQPMQLTGENRIPNSTVFSRKVIMEMESSCSFWTDLFTLLIKHGTIDNTDHFQEDVIAFLDSQHMPTFTRANVPNRGWCNSSKDVPASKPASASIVLMSLKNGGANPSWN